MVEVSNALGITMKVVILLAVGQERHSVCRPECHGATAAWNETECACRGLNGITGARPRKAEGRGRGNSEDMDSTNRSVENDDERGETQKEVRTFR